MFLADKKYLGLLIHYRFRQFALLAPCVGYLLIQPSQLIYLNYHHRLKSDYEGAQ